MNEEYSYSLLPLLPRWIRLLILLPGPVDSPLAIRLYKSNLDAVDPYTALSWEWGNPNQTTLIKVDHNRTLSISQSLEIALRSLREETENVILWVDQVCINQNDGPEKALQIPLMREIYSKAKTTVGWLGNIEPSLGFENMKRAVGRLQEIGQASVDTQLADLSQKEYARLLDDDVTQDIPQDRLTESKRRLRGLIAKFGDLLEQPEYKHINSICSLSYFRRGWILQELVIPPKLELRIGDLRIDGDIFCAAVLLIFVLVHHTRQPTSVYLEMNGPQLDTWVHPKAAIRNQFRIGKGERFFNLVSMMKKNATSLFGPAADSLPKNDKWTQGWENGMRDRVFGLLGLANDKEDLESKIDYTMSWQDVYSRTTKQIVQAQRPDDTWYGGTNVLSLCGTRRSGKELPSWAPDFSELMSIRTFADQTRNFVEIPFNVSQGSQHTVSDEAQYKDPNILICQGVLLDEIKRVGSKSFYGIEGDQGVNAFFKSLASLVAEGKERILSDASSDHPYHGNEKRLQETLWRLPVLDCELLEGPTSYRRCTAATHKGFLDTLRGIASEQSKHYVDALIMSKGKVPFLGLKGFIGIGEETVQKGDVICVIYGAAFPLVLRRVSGENNLYTLVGEAFVDGIMDGELMEMAQPCIHFRLK